MSAPCVTCGGPLPGVGRVVLAVLVAGAAYAFVFWKLERAYGAGVERQHAKFRVDLLEAIKIGAAVVIDRELAELGKPIEISKEPS